MQFQKAKSSDAKAIANLHAISWQQHYRGVFSDEYLDSAVHEERENYWLNLLNQKDPNRLVLLAKEEKKLVGFVCIYAHYDEKWQAYLDNLHVSKAQQGKSIGKKLMQKASEWVRTETPHDQFFLWVFEKNIAARKFYKKIGGKEIETCPFDLKKHGGGTAQSMRVVFRVE